MYLHGLCEDYLTCDIAFNAVMPLSHASTHGRYNRIEGITPLLFRWRRNTAEAIIINAIYTNNFTALITNSSPLYEAV